MSHGIHKEYVRGDVVQTTVRIASRAYWISDHNGVVTTREVGINLGRGLLDCYDILKRTSCNVENSFKPCITNVKIRMVNTGGRGGRLFG